MQTITTDSHELKEALADVRSLVQMIQSHEKHASIPALLSMKYVTDMSQSNLSLEIKKEVAKLKQLMTDMYANSIGDNCIQQ